jgi:hypothetical protein
MEKLMATFTEIKKKFFSLSPKEQELLLKEIYGLSKESKRFLDVRLSGANEENFIEEITKATQYATPKGYPKDIEVRKVNSILSNAKKCKVDSQILEKMELIAFEGYMGSLNEYGGGPDTYENKVYDHLNNYLNLVMSNHLVEEQGTLFDDMRLYLRQNTNMYYDHIWELFKELTEMDI